MNNLSKFLLILFICLGLWWGYDTFLADKIQSEEEPESQETVVKNDKEEKLPEKEQVTEEQKEENVYIYFLSSDKNGNQFLKPVSRPLAPGADRVEYAISQLLSGPNMIERSGGAYSEIPQETKLIKVTTSADKVIVDFTSNFGIGGGSDSIYSRMRQLIKTVLANTNKPVFLYLDGKQADILGGEGITFSQPLSEGSLDE